MRQWTDALGRDWTIHITVAAVRRVKTECELDLLNMLQGKLALELAKNPLQFGDLLAAVLRPQIGERKMSIDEFCEGLAGDALDRALELFLDELIDFFPNPDARTIFRRNRELLSPIIRRRFERDISNLETPEHRERLEAMLDAMLGGASTNSPE